MRILQFVPALLLVLAMSVAANSQEAHLTEPGSGAILSRSPFAHGYRHGYEEGYHQGNVDANMGRAHQSHKSRFSPSSLGYHSQFGSRQSFENGFRAGMRAGYYDGYAGLAFRAIDAARALAVNLPITDPGSGAPGDFDQGLSAGYRDGFERAHSSPAPTGLDFEHVNCAALSYSPAGSFCEGYRRGFVLGQVDELTLHREDILEASK